MNVLLVNLTPFGQVSYGILSLADALHGEGHNVKILGTRIGVEHLLSDPAGRAMLEETAVSFAPDIVGLSAMTPDADLITPFTALFKRLFNNVPVIFGGYHAMVFKDKVLRENNLLDFAFYGEAEEYFPRFLKLLTDGNTDYRAIKGLMYRTENGISVNAIPEAVSFDHLIPARAYNLLTDRAIELYNVPQSRAFNQLGSPQLLLQPNVPILLTRGCPYKCSFCSFHPANPYPKLRYLSPAAFQRQLDYIVKHYGPRSIFINDSSFDLNKAWAVKIVDLIERNRNIVEWACYVRPNLADESFFRRLRKARCSMLLLFLEGGTDRVRNEILNKCVTDDHLRTAFAYAHELDFFTRANMIVGCPTETREEFLQGVRFYNSLAPDSGDFPYLTIFPGTPLWHQYGDRMSVSCYRDFDIDNAADNLLRKDITTGFSNIDTHYLMDQTAALHVHSSAISGLLRKKVDAAGKSVLMLQTADNDNFYTCTGMLFSEHREYGEKCITLLTDKDRPVDPRFITPAMKLVAVDGAPVDIPRDNEVWNTLRTAQYDILIAAVAGRDPAGLAGLVELAGSLSIPRVVAVDWSTWNILEYDLKYKCVTETTIDTDLRFAAAQPRTASKPGPEQLSAEAVRTIVRLRWELLKARPGGADKVILFGAGKHTHWLLEQISDVQGPDIAAVLDDNPPVESIAGIPVIRPEAAGNIKADAVVISSDSAVALLIGRARAVFGESACIINLYEGLPPGPYAK